MRCAVFDFDGTLVHSNEIKARGFYEVVSGVEDAQEALVAILARPDAGDRSAVFAALAADLSGRHGRDYDHCDWVSAYTQHCEVAIVAAPEIEGAGAALRALREAGIACYLNSATPEEPLAAIVARRGDLGPFRGCYGAPADKVENLERIATLENLVREEIVMIGDSQADLDAALAFGCQFVGIGRDLSRFATAPERLLPDLCDLTEVILASSSRPDAN